MNAVNWGVLFANDNIIVPTFENNREADICTSAKRVHIGEVGENSAGYEEEFRIHPHE